MIQPDVLFQVLDALESLNSPEDTILSKLDWYRISPVLPQQLQDALGVYEVQVPHLDHAYLDRWAAQLGVADLLADIRRQAIS